MKTGSSVLQLLLLLLPVLAGEGVRGGDFVMGIVLLVLVVMVVMLL